MQVTIQAQAKWEEQKFAPRNNIISRGTVEMSPDEYWDDAPAAPARPAHYTHTEPASTPSSVTLTVQLCYHRSARPIGNWFVHCKCLSVDGM